MHDLTFHLRLRLRSLPQPLPPRRDLGASAAPSRPGLSPPSFTMLWHSAACLGLALLTLTAASTQSHLTDHRPHTATTSKTLVDILSDDPDGDYTSLLRLLQVARLIPTLNKLDGGTLFAPTNRAIESHPAWADVLHAPQDPETLDNVHEELRQELLYHLLDSTIPGLPDPDAVAVEKTLHFPHAPLEPPTNEPPPSPPWFPIPGGTLGGEPQKLRVSSRGDDSFVGVDAFGMGGVQIAKSRAEAANGVVYGIGEVLEVPRDLCEHAYSDARLSDCRINE